MVTTIAISELHECRGLILCWKSCRVSPEISQLQTHHNIFHVSIMFLCLMCKREMGGEYSTSVKEVFFPSLNSLEWKCWLLAWNVTNIISEWIPCLHENSYDRVRSPPPLGSRSLMRTDTSPQCSFERITALDCSNHAKSTVESWENDYVLR